MYQGGQNWLLLWTTRKNLPHSLDQLKFFYLILNIRIIIRRKTKFKQEKLTSENVDFKNLVLGGPSL